MRKYTCIEVRFEKQQHVIANMSPCHTFRQLPLIFLQASLEVMEDVAKVCLYFCGKELIRGKKLSDQMGRNEKTKVIVKIQKAGQGAPAREAVVSEQDQRDMMLYYHRKQEEWKKLEKEASEDPGLTMEDGGDLKRNLQGFRGDIRWH